MRPELRPLEFGAHDDFPSSICPDGRHVRQMRNGSSTSKVGVTSAWAGCPNWVGRLRASVRRRVAGALCNWHRSVIGHERSFGSNH